MYSCLCIKVWTKFSEYGQHKHARKTLLKSLLKAISRSNISHEDTYRNARHQESAGLPASSSAGESSVFHLPQVSRQQELLSLRHFALWALGEHVRLHNNN